MEIHKKTKFRKKIYLFLIILAAVLAVAVVIFAMFLHKPSYYKPLDYSNSKEVSQYLTHELLPGFYNGVQYQKPFSLVVSQSGINDIVARYRWPVMFDGVGFSAPMVFFAPGRIALMGTVLLNGTDLVVTVEVAPSVDNKGLMNLKVEGVKIGVVDITPLAGVLARRISQHLIADKAIDKKDLRAKITASVLDGEAFEPVFEIESKKVRVEKIAIEREKMTIWLVPVPE